MSDNLHNLNTEEIDQDQLEVDVALLQTQIATANTNITSLFSQTAGTGTSGLKSLVQANDVDIAAIQSKTNLLTINEAVDLDNYDDVNSNLTSINGMLEKDGTETILKTGAGNKIQFSVGGQNIFNSNEIKNLTDNVLISSNVNINTLDTELTGIKNNSLASTLKTAVDANSSKTGITSDQTNAIVANTSKNSYPSVDSTKVGHITVTEATSLDSIRNEINNINIQSSFLLYGHLRLGDIDTDTVCFQHKDLNSGNLANTHGSVKIDNEGNLKLNVPTSKTFEFQINNVKQYDNSEIKNLVDNISVTQAVDLDTMESNISTNNAKVSTQWSNNGSEVYIAQNVGIRTSDPNSDLEIGDGTTNVRMRLNGQNSQTNSSEIIFTDNRSGTNPEYYMGASIRFNSTDNRLEFLTDAGNDGSAEPAMFIYRSATPFIQVTHILADDLSVQTCNLRPLSVYCYGRRVNSLTDTDNDITLSTSGVDVVYRNILTNGIVYNTSTGVFTVPSTALYEITASVQIDCGAGAESIINIILKDAANNNLLKARGHVSRAESNNSTATQLNMIGMIRLVAGTSYNFVVASKNTGTGTIQNDIATCNTLMIKGVILQNDVTVPSDWGEAA